MPSSFDQGFCDGEFDALSSSGYDPDYAMEESSSYPDYEDGYDAGFEEGIQKRRAKL